MAELIVKPQGPIGHIIFANEARYNAVTHDMWLAFPKAIAQLDADPDIRLIVLQGAGSKAFVSGADISQFKSQRTDADAQQAYNQAVDAAYLAPLHCAKPVVAKIRGICMGGGLGLAAACDLRFCTTDSRFRMPAARLGLGYGATGVSRFLAVLGLQNTLDVFLSARIFDAAEALRMGFVSQVAVPEAFDAQVDTYCGLLAENAPLTLRALKKTVVELGRPAHERDMAAVNAAIKACSEKRRLPRGKPGFHGKTPAGVSRGVT